MGCTNLDCSRKSFLVAERSGSPEMDMFAMFAVYPLKNVAGS
jgi:hypothetical protein